MEAGCAVAGTLLSCHLGRQVFRSLGTEGVSLAENAGQQGDHYLAFTERGHPGGAVLTVGQQFSRMCLWQPLTCPNGFTVAFQFHLKQVIWSDKRPARYHILRIVECSVLSLGA